MEATGWKRMIHGALWGMSVSLAYATVEFILLGVAPLILEEKSEWNGSFGVGTGLLFAAFLIVGAIGGGLAGLIVSQSTNDEEDPDRLRVALTGLLAAIFLANLALHWPLTGGSSISAGIAIILIGLVARIMRNSESAGSLVVFTDPFCVSLLLLIPSWISSELLPGRSTVYRLSAVGLSLAAVLLLTYLVSRLLKSGTSNTPWSYGLKMFVVLGLTVGIGLALNPKAPSMPRAKAAPQAKGPNVVMVVMDTVRADHTSLYGYERDTTPFLRQLAKEATVYEHTAAAADFTLPTHATIFTGLYPRTHGAYRVPRMLYGRPLDRKFTTLTEVLSSAGYRTAAVAANRSYLAPYFQLDQGFEAYDWRGPVLMMDPESVKFALRAPLSRLLPGAFATGVLAQRAMQADEVTEEGIRLLSASPADAPSFLFLNYMDAHEYVPPAPFRSEYSCHDWSLIRRYDDVRSEVNRSRRQLSEEDRACLIGQYDAAIRYMDSQIERLVQVLKQQGKYENTLLVVTADHGESFGQGILMGHGGMSVSQEQINVPLVIKYPGVTAAERVPFEISQVDLMPTILSVVNLKVPDGVAGRSLANLNVAPARPVLSVSYLDELLARQNPAFRRTEEAVFADGKKFISSTSGKRELYNLSSDPHEEHNLYQSGDPEATKFMAILEEWHKAVPMGSSKAGSANTDRQAIDRLKTLGYAQ